VIINDTSIVSISDTTLDPLDYLNPNSLNIVDYKLKTSSKIGFSTGFKMRYHYKRFALSTGLGIDIYRYTHKFQNKEDAPYYLVRSLDFGIESTLIYLNIPIERYYYLTNKIHLKLGGAIEYLPFVIERKKESFRVYNSTEPQIRKETSHSKENFNLINMALRAGVEYQLNRKCALILDYRVKINNVYDNYLADGIFLSTNLQAIHLGVELLLN